MASRFRGSRLFSLENKGCPLLPGSFLLAHSRLSPHSGYVSQLIGPTLPGNMKYCLRFYFSLRGEWHPKKLWIKGYLRGQLWWLRSMCESFAVMYFTDSPTRNNFGNCRFQSDGPGSHCASAAAERQPGEDLDSGGEVQRNLDRDRRHFPDVTAGQGQRRGNGNITSDSVTNEKDVWKK